VKLMSQLSAGPNIVKVFGSDERPIGHVSTLNTDSAIRLRISLILYRETRAVWTFWC
jgi:hypothetical protein